MNRYNKITILVYAFLTALSIAACGQVKILAFYISDLNMDSGEWGSFSVGEKVDLDNDGENELVINGPYGGMYLNARDNRVYKFAAEPADPDNAESEMEYTWNDAAISYDEYTALCSKIFAAEVSTN